MSAPSFGRVVDVVALAVGLGALMLLVGSLLGGCGASALQSHATAATVITVAAQGAGDVAVASVELAAQRCQDAPCVERVREAGAVVAVTHESLRIAALTYREAVEVAAAAQEGDALLSALVTALARVVVQWDALVAVLRERLDADLPSLPPVVRSMLDALAGPS